MTLAKTLLKLWRLRLWVALGLLVAGVAAVGSFVTSHSTVYATASTEMLVDSPNSALTNSNVLLDGYIARASVFARLMTSDDALQDIGKAAGINGNLIEASGPMEINGSPTATHAPVAIQKGKDLQAPKIYKLSFVQNPSLPTVEVFASAPTTAEAIRLANGAVAGFATFVSQLNPGKVPASERVDIRELGPATGGIVDPTASKSMALLVFVGVFAIWCWLVLFVHRLRSNLRAAKTGAAEEVSGMPEASLMSSALLRSPAVSPGGSPVANVTNGDPSTRPFDQSVSSRLQSEIGSNGRTFVRR